MTRSVAVPTGNPVAVAEQFRVGLASSGRQTPQAPVRSRTVALRRGEGARLVGYVFRIEREMVEFWLEVGLSRQVWQLPATPGLSRLLDPRVPRHDPGRTPEGVALILTATWRRFMGRQGKPVEAHGWRVKNAQAVDLPAELRPHREPLPAPWGPRLGPECPPEVRAALHQAAQLTQRPPKPGPPKQPGR